jgi:hypothetical protein
MTATYDSIATTTLGSAASTITFSSIPATYTDLHIVLVATTTVADAIYIRYNGDTGANYSRTVLQGDGSTAASSRQSSENFIYLTRTNLDTTLPQLFEIDVFSYAGSTNKTCLVASSQDKNGSGLVVREVGLWRNTSAITEVLLSSFSSTFKIGTTATLYGIKSE